MCTCNGDMKIYHLEGSILLGSRPCHMFLMLTFSASPSNTSQAVGKYRSPYSLDGLFTILLSTTSTVEEPPSKLAAVTAP